MKKMTKEQKRNRKLARRIANYLFTDFDNKTVVTNRLVCEGVKGPKLNGAGWCYSSIVGVIEKHLSRARKEAA